MKKTIVALLITASSLSAFADHSLKHAMNDSIEIKSAVVAAITAKKVVCDLKNTIQMKATVANASWRQVALCYKTKKDQMRATADLATGNSGLGIYGTAAEAILDVEYSQNSTTYKMEKIISVNIK